MKKFLAAVAITGAAAFGLAAPAGAATGNQQFQITGLNNKQTVQATGPIAGTGKDIQTSAETDKFVFAHGSIVINHPTATEKDTQSFDPTTCTGRFSFTGIYTLGNGTGVYKGVTGSGTYRGTGVFVGKKTSKGCSDTGATSVVTIFARGTTTTP